MKKKSFFILILSLILLAVIIVCGRYFIGNNHSNARLSEFKGDVQITKSGGKSTFNAFNGMLLVEGDQIKTGKGSWVVLEIENGEKEVKIFENSFVNIGGLESTSVSNEKKTVFDILSGKIIANIKKKLDIHNKFEISTPTTIAGARGTMYFVEQKEDKTNIGVLEGTVDVAFKNNIKDEFRLQKNQQTAIDKKTTSSSETKIDEIKTDMLDADILIYIKENSDRVDKKLLNGITTIIIKKLEKEYIEDSENIKIDNRLKKNGSGNNTKSEPEQIKAEAAKLGIDTTGLSQEQIKRKIDDANKKLRYRMYLEDQARAFRFSPDGLTDEEIKVKLDEAMKQSALEDAARVRHRETLEEAQKYGIDPTGLTDQQISDKIVEIIRYESFHQELLKQAQEMGIDITGLTNDEAQAKINQVRQERMDEEARIRNEQQDKLRNEQQNILSQ